MNCVVKFVGLVKNRARRSELRNCLVMRWAVSSFEGFYEIIRVQNCTLYCVVVLPESLIQNYSGGHGKVEAPDVWIYHWQRIASVRI